MKLPLIFYYRKIHRYFGVIIGIQFLFWTLGGLFFSWSNMDQIHGDTNRNPDKLITQLDNWQNPSVVFEKIIEHSPVDSVISFKTISFLGEPFYQIKYFSLGEQKLSLVNVHSGEIRHPLNQSEAVRLAQEVFTPASEIQSIEYLDKGTVGKHHEYRDGPLPAYAITFAHSSGTNVYVSTELAQVITFRNSNWRIFDFLWMMHTMDYKNRDNIGNILLRIFSLLGVITILSGFVLYYKSSPWIYQRQRKNKDNLNK